ncbi:unnamed protein product [Ectocarpus sp. 4 AP-2014]
MLPGDIHFAAVWPAAPDGAARKVIVPLQCSLAEASRTVGNLVSLSRKQPPTPGTSEIETLALGPFCVFSTSTSTPSALVVVGTKSWGCSPGVFAFLRRVQTDLARDPSDFGFWQLRHLASRVEASLPPTGDDASYAMPPRLFEGRNWDDEESESWEDEYMWSDETVDNDGLTGVTAVPDDARGMSLVPVFEPLRSDGVSMALSPLTVSQPEDANTLTGATRTEHATGHADEGISLNKMVFDGLPPKAPHRPTKPMMTDQRTQQPSGPGFGSPVVDRRPSPVGDCGSPLLIPPDQAPALATAQPANANVDADKLLPPLAMGAGFSPLRSDGESSSATPDEISGLQAVSAVDLSALTTSSMEGRFNAAVGDEPSIVVGPTAEVKETVDGAPTVVPGGETGMQPAAEPHAIGPQVDSLAAGVTGSKAGLQDRAGDAGAETETDNAMVSAAVSEDLAYVHRGPALQSYGITGSVLVAASCGARAQVRVTDKQGHIATATANPKVAEERPAVAVPPAREYLCKPGAVQHGGAPPRFLPALMYRCSPAVKILPVRVTCRLRTAGNRVLVWVQVIANPQLPQPLSGVSVLVNLPFSPRDEGDVKSEPPATLKMDRKMLEWVLPSGMQRGGKQVLQARLSADEGQVRVAAIPQTAPAMVKCHLLDSTFSSVELEVAAMAEEGVAPAGGSVVKRCRVQCKQV